MGMASTSPDVPGSISLEETPKQRQISPAVLLIPLWLLGLVTHVLQRVDGQLVFVSPGALILVIYGLIGLILTTIAIFAIRADTRDRQEKHRLQIERNQLRALIDSLPDFVYIKDTESRFVIANRPLAAYFGTDRPGSVNRAYRFRLPPHGGPPLRADEQRVMATGQPIINQEEPLSLLGARPGVVLTSKVPLRDAQGTIVGLVGIGRDVTRHRQTLSALQSVQELSSAMLRALPILLFEIDREATVLRFQTALEKMTLPLPDQIQGRSLAEFLPPLAMNAIRGVIERTAHSGGHDTVSFSVDTLEEEHWFEVWVAPTRDMRTDFQRFIILIHDVTSRKRIETQLEETLAAELKQRLLAETISELTLALTSSMSPGAVMVEILQQVRRLVDHNVATISLVEGDQLRSVRHVTTPNSSPLTANNMDSYPIESVPIEAEIVRTGQPYIVVDAREEPRWQWHEGWEWLRAYVGMPIKLGDEIVGLLCLACGEVGCFTQEDIERLQPFVSAAAIALENARLYEGARQQIAEREQAERALRRAYDSLETKVQERTFALATANNVLQTEIAEREQAEGKLQDLLEAYQHRNRQLQVVAEVSKSASASLDEHTLGDHLVDLIRDSFNFYYVGLFLADETEPQRRVPRGYRRCGPAHATGRPRPTHRRDLDGRALYRPGPRPDRPGCFSRHRPLRQSLFARYPFRDRPTPDLRGTLFRRAHHPQHGARRVHSGGRGHPAIDGRSPRHRDRQRPSIRRRPERNRAPPPDRSRDHPAQRDSGTARPGAHRGAGRRQPRAGNVLVFRLARPARPAARHPGL